MPLLTPGHRFLLDENVRIELYRFLKKHGFNVKLAPKSATDKELASLSVSEKRILITNDQDFIEYAKDEIFCVVWLRIPQNDLRSLLSTFQKLLKDVKDFLGKQIHVGKDNWEEFPLYEKLKINE